MTANPESIRMAYRLLLGREPDEQGFAHYCAKAEQGMSIDELRSSILSSFEYKNLIRSDRSTLDTGRGFLICIDPFEPEFGRAISESLVWEPHLLKLIGEELRAGDVFVDIGANVGMMTLMASTAVGPSGRVLAFEPHPENVFHLMRGIVANEFKNVTLYPFALSNRCSSFAIRGSSNGILAPLAHGDTKAITLIGDELLQHEDTISFIKLDVEGHEPFALRGLKKTLSSHRPKILCEFNPTCLNEHSGLPPEQFAEELFQISDSVIAIEHDGGRTGVNSADELMKLWAAKNETAVRSGHLPDGMLHFDLLLQPRS